MSAQQAWVAGSDRPEKETVNVGFMPLTDCASLVVASMLGFDLKHGIKIELVRAPSWASVRDRLVSGEFDAAHALYGMVYGVELGIGGPQADMAIMMTLSQNGQSVTLSRALAQAGVRDGNHLTQLIHANARRYTFAQTFPTGTHAMWLYYWLAAHGIDPINQINAITVPPPQMVASMRGGLMDGFCVGEPWGDLAISEGAGVTIVTTQDIWPDHPEKVLAAKRGFVERYPNTARALTMAVLEASRWIDASDRHREATAGLIAGHAFVHAPLANIEPRLLGRYSNGLGLTWTDPHPTRFFGEGQVNFPYHSDGMWFVTQLVRWGLLRDVPDFRSVVAQVQKTDLYRDAATQLRVPLPSSEHRSVRFFDGQIWDGSDPVQYTRGFAIRA